MEAEVLGNQETKFLAKAFNCDQISDVDRRRDDDSM